MKHFFSLLSLIAALTTQPGRAQVATMNLTGSVESDERVALAGAAVTVIHLPSGTRYAAASNAAGRFLVANLPAGGPYLMQVGEAGYRSQTLESIFLEKGKTATFALTLSKMASGSAKAGPGRTGGPPVVTDALAKESVVGGPVLFTTSTKGYQSRFQPVAQINPAGLLASAAGAGTQAPATRPAPAPVVAAPAAPRANPYPARPLVTRVKDIIVPGHYDKASGNYIYETGALTSLKLAGGGAIANVGTNSTESFLHRFLTDPQVQVDTVDLTKGWYNFDRVFFDSGKATLTGESLSQLRNVAALLRAYPKARIKLGGYTDSTGTYKVNKLLSDARARTAWASLVEMGISPARIEARGYGPRYTIATNSTEEGRAKNRRLSVKVVQK